jgi:hypothetical protein
VSNNQWQFLSPNGVGQPRSVNISGGGGATRLSGYRSIQDARRSAAAPGRTPQAEYPDGYLGNVNSRRDDKLLNSVQSRLTQRSYQRGVHKGERVNPQDYYWNDVVNPQAGIEAEAKGLKWTQVGSTPVDQINHMGKNHLLAPQDFDRVANSVGVQTPNEINPVRSSQMSRLLPTWK